MRSSWLRWALIVVPALVVTLFDYVRHIFSPSFLHAWPGSLVFTALVFVGSTVITHAVFGLFERRRRSLLWLAGELTALGSVTGRSSAPRREVFEAILDRVLRSLPASAGAIYLRGSTPATLRQAAVLGDPAAVAALPDVVDAEDAVVAQALRSGRVVIDERFVAARPHAGGAPLRRPAALVPLRSRDQALGLLLLLARDGGAALRGDVDLLLVLGSQAGVIVDNLRLYEEMQQLLEQSRTLAALEERDRLAREMHDSLAQVLGLVGIKARIIQELLARGDHARATAELADVAETADSAYVDVREAIHGLRGSTSARALIGTLREYVQQFGRQSGIRTRLVVNPAAATRFPPATEMQLLRVIQEALTNVRKHARATTAVVSFTPDEERPGGVRIVVEDDGCGFDPARVTPAGGHGYGLQTMSERVAGLGGKLSVESQPGRGTRVAVVLPPAPDDRPATDNGHVGPALAARGR